jgi:hypothetical protein
VTEECAIVEVERRLDTDSETGIAAALVAELAIEVEHGGAPKRRAVLEALAAQLAVNAAPAGPSQWAVILDATEAALIAAVEPTYAVRRNPDAPVTPGTLAMRDGSLTASALHFTGRDDWQATIRLILALEGDEATMSAARTDTWELVRAALRTDPALRALGVWRLTDEELSDAVPLLATTASTSSLALDFTLSFATSAGLALAA